MLTTLFANRDGLLTRINVVEFNRFFSNNPVERFSVVLPILEAYLKRRYTSGDEKTYQHMEKAFFDWVEKSENADIAEFSRKHISVKGSKSPSLPTLISRAIAFVNQHGFRFPEEMADRLQKRRGRLFHSASQIDESNVLDMHLEVQAATGLLMLHTLDDLGIDIAPLSREFSALGDFLPFLAEPKRLPDNISETSSGSLGENAQSGRAVSQT